MGRTSVDGDGRDRRPRFLAGGGDVLLLSMRRVHGLVAFCAAYEFEDVTRDVTGADQLEPVDIDGIELARRTYKAVRKGVGSRALAGLLSYRPPSVRLTRDYELFFPVFNHPFELFGLSTVTGWRDRCRTKACFVNELWVRELPDYLLELLSGFDHVFVGTQNSAAEVARITGRPCTYLPLAADVLRFAPPALESGRPIDVCNIGRRSEVTHEALVGLARERRIFYYYDTVAASGDGRRQITFRVGNPGEHRLLLASLLQRTRFFVAYRARINEPEFTNGLDEISGRFYEGIAAGALIVGEPPRCEEFRRQFDWPDVVMDLPFHSPDVADRLASLSADPERLGRARAQNVRNAASRHDWLNRLEVVFQKTGVDPTPGMVERRARLASLGDSIGPGVSPGR
jgi:hypothetical protein